MVKHIQLVSLAGGVQLDELCAKTQGLLKVAFLPHNQVDEVGGYLQAADVLSFHLADSLVYHISVVPKTQACFLAGKPF